MSVPYILERESEPRLTIGPTLGRGQEALATRQSLFRSFDVKHSISVHHYSQDITGTQHEQEVG